MSKPWSDQPQVGAPTSVRGECIGTVGCPLSHPEGPRPCGVLLIKAWWVTPVQHPTEGNHRGTLWVNLGERDTTASGRDAAYAALEFCMVFVLSSDGQPLDPCHPARARQVLRRGRARVVRRFPMTIQLLDRRADQSTTHSLRLKIDPGSRTTGLALVTEESATVVWAAELTHRSGAIRDALLARRAFRSNRRQAPRGYPTRYRPARFRNRRRPAGWLAPSLRSRVEHIMTWYRRLAQRCPIRAISLELVRFDTQALVDPEIGGIAYQQGELLGYEVREYLLEKWGRICAYCGGTGVPLQVEHIVPRTRGGSDRVSNLTLACEPCNQRKGAQTAAEFGFPLVQAQAQQPLRDAASVNSTRWVLYQALQATGLSVEAGTGGRTKYNRTRLGWEKTHWQDAACVGASTPDRLRIATPTVLQITATGRGLHSRTKLDKYGFPRLRLPRQKRFFGVQTGDMVEARVLSGTKQGRYVGRVAVRASGSFNVTTVRGTVQGLHHRFVRVLQRADGYRYAAVRFHHPRSTADGWPQPPSSHRSSGGFLRRFL
jgi:5-methylcytosine-specific restriction endonuclease McrA